METKTCTKCNDVKPLEMFSKRASSPDGFNSWCKQCYSDYRKKHAARQKPNLPPHHIKKCGKCGKAKPAAAFYKDVYSLDGHTHWCKQCILVRQRDYVARLREQAQSRR